MFFEPSLHHPYANGIRENVVFTNNTAGTAGNELFGGWGNICISHSLNLYEVGEDYFNSAFHFSPDPMIYLQLPQKHLECAFVQKPPYFPTACSITQYNTTSYPGSTVHISVVTTGQRFGVVPGIVTVTPSVREGLFPTFQQYQTTLNHCTEVGYTVSSPNPAETLALVPQDGTSGFNGLNAKMSNLLGIHDNGLILTLFAVFEVNVFLLPCPVGFVLDLTTSTCDCRNLLKDYAINCSIETQEIHRRAPL